MKCPNCGKETEFSPKKPCWICGYELIKWYKDELRAHMHNLIINCLEHFKLISRERYERCQKKFIALGKELKDLESFP